jgi:hypothetical protein
MINFFDKVMVLYGQTGGFLSFCCCHWHVEARTDFSRSRTDYSRAELTTKTPSGSKFYSRIKFYFRESTFTFAKQNLLRESKTCFAKVNFASRK